MVPQRAIVVSLAVIVSSIAATIQAVVLQLPVQPSLNDMSAEVLRRLTTVTAVVDPDPQKLDLKWLSSTGSESEVHFELAIVPGPTYLNGKGIDGLVESANGRLRYQAKGRMAEWTVDKRPWGGVAAASHFLPDKRKLVFILPLSFRPEGATGSEVVHAPVLISCSVDGTRVSCQPPRLLFVGDDGAHPVPCEPDPRVVLPFLSDRISPLLPPNQAACCLHEDPPKCFCVTECPIEPGCNPCHCWAHECLTCLELECQACGTQ